MTKLELSILDKKSTLAEVSDKVREDRFKWFGYVLRRPLHVAVGKYAHFLVEGVKRGERRPKSTWKEVVVKDLCILDIEVNLVHTRLEWKCKIHVDESF